MARREDIVNTIWDELDHLSNDAVLLYVWSWTNPRCGMAGIYKVPERRLLEGRLEDPAAALAELARDGKLRYEDGVLWNVARVKRLSHISEQIAKSIAKDLAEIDPSNPVYVEFVERYGSHPKLEGHLNLNRGSRDPQENPSVEPIGRGSPEGHPTLSGRSRSRGQGEGSDFGSILEALDRAAFRRGTTLKSDSAQRACEAFADRDLETEVEKFAHYWTDGPGESRSLKDVAWAWRNWLERSEPAPKASDHSKYDQKIRRTAA